MKITRVRGDNYPIVVTLKVNGVAIDLTGSVIKLSYKNKNGTDAAYQIAGTITDALNGVVEFRPLATDFAIAGQYIYDIQREFFGIITTHILETLILIDDVTKT
ncbi:MAG: hypothetical protein QG567_2333 [Campylobacterota bacterium]|nr:hypothetical protein [Campylobacterota bacterium]